MKKRCWNFWSDDDGAWLGHANNVLLSLLLFAAVSAEAATLSQPQQCDDLTGIPINFRPLDWRADILPLLEAGGCVGCHSDGGVFPPLPGSSPTPLMDLFVNVGSNTSLNYVEPFFPLRSYLFQKVNCDQPAGGTRMPLAGFPLTIEQQGMLYDWIYQGAMGEAEPEFVFRVILFRDGLESLR